MTSRKKSLPLPGQCVCGKTDCKIPYGFCHCGCGKSAPVSRYQQPKNHLFFGFPAMFCFGHKSRSRRNCQIIGPFKIDGVCCCLIPVNLNLWTIIDIADYEKVSQFTWRAVWKKRCRTFYVVTSLPRRSGEPRKSIPIHRFVTGSEADEVDHKNHNGLDNRRKNLRPCTKYGNMANTVLMSTNTSGYKGVFPDRRRGGWIGSIQHRKKPIRKHFATAQAAHEWYQEMALKLFGEFANPTGALEFSQSRSIST